jgi:hypothetical protein
MNTIDFLNIESPELDQFRADIETQLEEGYLDALKVFVKLKMISDALSEINKGIKDKALEEAQKYSQKSFSAFGAKIEIREMGAKWYFDKTNDPFIKNIELEKGKILEKEKERQAFLKTIKEKTIIVNEETGEAFEVYPARKESSTGIAISFI